LARLWSIPGNSATHRSKALKCARKNDNHRFTSTSSFEVLLSLLSLFAVALIFALFSAGRLLPLLPSGLLPLVVAVAVALLLPEVLLLLLALDSEEIGATPPGLAGA
jgi:hypothetical protein